MKRVVLVEHARLIRWTRDEAPPAGDGVAYLEGRLYDRLRRFDRDWSTGEQGVFVWEDGCARARQWVGVVEVPGLQVEILPKIDGFSDSSDLDSKTAHHGARSNLLYMLSVAGEVPVLSRDLAQLASRRAPLLDLLIALFAERLLAELLRGPESAYIEHEENLRRFRGKLAPARQALENAAHRERFYCRFHEFSADTALNRLFRASCLRLLQSTHTPTTQDALRHCLLLLESVRDAVLHEGLFEQIVITRQNERYADLLRFCRWIFSGRAPLSGGGERAFSLLFDMNQVFERFVARFFQTRVLPRLEGCRLHPQAVGERRHLMHSGGRGVLLLRPDLLLEAAGGRLVIDTKWKRLGPAVDGGASPADLYQLYAYTHRYGCRRSVLLYPYAPGSVPRDFQILDSTGQDSGEQVAIRFICLHRDLHREAERQALALELEAMVREALAGEHP